jgi:prepilin-type N-terminal cleavage/methylation domain-containing protein
MNNIRHLLNDRRGFSLFELLVTVLVTSIVAGAIISLLSSQIQLTTTQNRSILNQENVRDTVEFMGDELSNAGANCEEPYFTIANPYEVEFVGDQDGDGSPDKVRYFVSNGILNRSVYSTNDGGATWTLQSTDQMLDNVYSLNFTYYAFDNLVPVDASEITSVEIMLEVDTSQNTTTYTQGKLRSEAMLRRVTVRNRML